MLARMLAACTLVYDFTSQCPGFNLLTCPRGNSSVICNARATMHGRIFWKNFSFNSWSSIAVSSPSKTRFRTPSVTQSFSSAAYFSILSRKACTEVTWQFFHAAFTAFQWSASGARISFIWLWWWWWCFCIPRNSSSIDHSPPLLCSLCPVRSAGLGDTAIGVPTFDLLVGLPCRLWNPADCPILGKLWLARKAGELKPA
mmetsp:Transcript_72624/g.151666  ORF Transcript_72624/g.151666 Transcript_72624/m.151666 type:complete len:200 (-) Transcript_72624:610-1209(-)